MSCPGRGHVQRATPPAMLSRFIGIGSARFLFPGRARFYVSTPPGNFGRDRGICRGN